MAQPNSLRKMGLIVAVDKNLGIGKNGSLPWRLRKDMQYFAERTSSTTDPTKVNAVIMGRKCWESIPEKFRPLKNRLNIVISRTLPEHRDENLIISNDFDKIVKELLYGQLSANVERVWNIGGGEIYKLALEKGMVDQILMTRIQKEYKLLALNALSDNNDIYCCCQVCQLKHPIVHGFDADVFLEEIDWNHYQEDESSHRDIMNENGIDFSFHSYTYIE